MQEEHCKNNPQQKRKRSPEELVEARRASAQKYSDRRIQLGMMFHAAQQEAYESSLQLDKWADAQEEVSDTTHHG